VFEWFVQLDLKGLTRLGARGVEQTLLNRLKEQGLELGSSLGNQINSIAESSDVYVDATAYGGIALSIDILAAVLAACLAP
jgi:hypothetical protein